MLSAKIIRDREETNLKPHVNKMSLTFFKH